MNDCIWILIAFVAITLLVLYICYLVSLHGRVQRLEHRASPRLEIIEREIHGIGCYMRIITGIAIFFCVCVSVHYLCYCHPHIFSEDAPKPDSLGTVVAIFGVVVTLLVGWQIYSTIKVREELRIAKDEMEKRLSSRIEKIEDCCENRRNEIAKLKSQADERLNEKSKEIQEASELQNKYNEAKLRFSQAMSLTLIADFQGSLKENCFKETDKNTKEIRFQYSMAYLYFFEALVYYIQFDRQYSAMDACINNMSLNLKRIENDSNDKEKFENKTYDKCDKLYDTISPILTNQEIDKELSQRIYDLNNRRVKVRKFNLEDTTGIKEISGKDSLEAFEWMRKIIAKARREKEAEEQSRQTSEPKNDENSGS